MSRATGGGIDVARLYKRFVLLVMMPTACLVGFGVLAIHNERAVVEQRLTQQYSNRLRLLAGHLTTLIEMTADGFGKGISTNREAIVRFEFSYRNHVLTPTRTLEPTLHESLVAAMESFRPTKDSRVVLFPILIGPARGLYALHPQADGTLSGLAFSESGLSMSVMSEADFLYKGDNARYTLEGPQDSPMPLVRPLRSSWSELTGDQIESGVISQSLPGTLADWRVVAEISGDDPLRSALFRNRFVYIVTLVLCSVIISLGAFTTLRGIWLEAKLSRLRTDFVSNISHEIRTPLTSIRMFAETLRTGRAQTPEEQAVCIDFISKESERLSALAERTLNWSRIEAGQHPFKFEQEPVPPLLDEALSSVLVRGLVPREAITLDIDETTPEVWVDRLAFSQVLLNLIENAVKYSGSDKKIVIRIRHEQRNVFIDVEDNGIGIAPKDQKRIFERFYRADDLLARQTEGTGLGLSISRRIVDAHHGRLTLRSEVGRGSVFTVQLPAVVSAPLGSSAPKERVA